MAASRQRAYCGTAALHASALQNSGIRAGLRYGNHQHEPRCGAPSLIPGVTSDSLNPCGVRMRDETTKRTWGQNPRLEVRNSNSREQRRVLKANCPVGGGARRNFARNGRILHLLRKRIGAFVDHLDRSQACARRRAGDTQGVAPETQGVASETQGVALNPGFAGCCGLSGRGQECKLPEDVVKVCNFDLRLHSLLAFGSGCGRGENCQAKA